jgi:hypothetical protein
VEVRIPYIYYSCRFFCKNWWDTSPELSEPKHEKGKGRENMFLDIHFYINTIYQILYITVNIITYIVAVLVILAYENKVASTGDIILEARIGFACATIKVRS